MGYAASLAWVLFAVILVFTVIQLQSNRFVHYEGGEK
jgi:ABC-type sugar transport system permease subunit